MTSSPPDTKKRPNVLWICTDSQRWDTLGCYGNELVNTPNLDALAAKGVLFEHVFAQNPLCQPSRGSFLTGRYPRTTGLRQNGQDIPEDEILVTRRLAEAGYLCGLSGKLHLSACDHRLERFGREFWKHPNEEYFDGVERRINDGYAEFYWDHAPGHPSPSSSYARWLQERGLSFPKPVARPESPLLKTGIDAENHQTAFCCEKAEGFIRAHAGRHYPWLFSVNIFDPHFDFDPPDEYLQRYADKIDQIPLPNFDPDELDSKPAALREFRDKQTASEMTDTEHRWAKAAYWAMVDLIDERVGRLLQVLEETGQDENTIVIFTSDHGEMLGDHGIYKKGPFLYEGAMRVPLMIYWKGRWEGGRRVADLVELSDLAPTIAEACGLPREPGMQTRSLVPVLDGTSDREVHRDSVYAEYCNSNPHPDPLFATMVRTDSAKLIRHHSTDEGELYDLAADPQERRNLWNDPNARSLQIELMNRLADRLAFAADPIPPRRGVF